MGGEPTTPADRAVGTHWPTQVNAQGPRGVSGHYNRPSTEALTPDDTRVEPRISCRSALLVPDRAEVDRLADQHGERDL
jgi:hypothetical protein